MYTLHVYMYTLYVYMYTLYVYMYVYTYAALQVRKWVRRDISMRLYKYANG